jgi:AcrR family transcriptional regulator
MNRARTARERAREQLTREIVDAARAQLAVVGATGLSLRAVARDLGMVSSAVYRYVASRDDLLTRLIIEAYDALGEAVERAEAAVPRDDLVARWQAACAGVRGWALAHPHEYALIFGSPVPGYAAPQATIEPATRVPRVLIALLVEALETGRYHLGRAAEPADAVRKSLAPLHAQIPDLPEDLLARGLLAWTLLVGAVSFELFGHTHNVVDDDPALREAFFADQMTRAARMVGLQSSPDPDS